MTTDSIVDAGFWLVMAWGVLVGWVGRGVLETERRRQARRQRIEMSHPSRTVLPYHIPQHMTRLEQEEWTRDE